MCPSATRQVGSLHWRAYLEDEHGQEIAFGDNEFHVFHHAHIGNIQREDHWFVDCLLEEHLILSQPFHGFPCVHVLML